jgi:riboflavin synthase
MFTGLVQAVGRVTVAAARNGLVRLDIDPGSWEHRSRSGDSISVSGCCLTVAAEPGGPAGCLAFDVVPETLAKTTLGSLRPGSKVNLERSLAAGDLLGGHFVQGHVDGTGALESVQSGADWRIRVRPPTGLLAYLAPKGSITVEGVSLTIAAVDVAAGGGAGWFEVALIPTTLEKTTLGALKEGDRVNLETDILARTVVNYMRHFAGDR